MKFPTPDELQTRAAGAGLSLAELLRRAKAPQQTFHRWKSEGLPKPIQQYARVVTAVEQAERDAAARAK